jgi:hypothetical protein
MKIPTPNFKFTFTFIGISFMSLALLLFAKGLLKSMAEFQVPDDIIDSPHYQDAITWVYIHMIVLGILVLYLGRFVNAIRHQKIVTITVTIAILFYTYLDIRTSDSSLGNALYKGKSSLGPAMINCIFLLLLVGTITKLFSKKNN